MVSKVDAHKVIAAWASGVVLLLASHLKEKIVANVASVLDTEEIASVLEVLVVLLNGLLNGLKRKSENYID